MKFSRHYYYATCVTLIFLVVSLVITYRNRSLVKECWELIRLSKSKVNLNTANFETSMPAFIAHGGGLYKNIERSNTLNALDENIKLGVSYFEIDFNWSSDGQLVGIHDWEAEAQRLTSQKEWLPTLEEFEIRMESEGFKPITLNSLLRWMDENPNAVIITDIKKSNQEGLRKIWNVFEKHRMRFIPQVYSISEYGKVQEVGFSEIILTLYRSNYSDKGLVEFAKKARPWAVAMPVHRAKTKLPCMLDRVWVPTFVHGVYDEKTLRSLADNCINGAYANRFGITRDSLSPK